MRCLLCLATIWLMNCNSLWDSFKEPNQNSCTFTPQLCGLTASQQEQGPDIGFGHDDIFNKKSDSITDGLQVPPFIGEKLHSCGKVRFNTIVNILYARGIDIASTVPSSAGDLLVKTQPSSGVASFSARLPEAIRNTKSSLIGLHDVLIAAAEEWVPMDDQDGTFPARATACTGAKLFNNNTCDKEGFACLMGATPTQRQLELCNSMINNTSEGASDPLARRRLAAAAMFGTVVMCD